MRQGGASSWGKGNGKEEAEVLGGQHVEAEPGRMGGTWACIAGEEGTPKRKESVSQGTEWETTVGSVKAGG